MKIAMPLNDNENKIKTYFSGANLFIIYEVEIELVKSKIFVEKGDKSLSEFLNEEDINVVICNKIYSGERNLLRFKRIELVYGVNGSADEVVVRYLSGEDIGQIDENAYWRTKEKV